MRFRLGSFGAGLDVSPEAARAMAGGDFRLPGVFGVAQDIAGAWTDQRGGPAWMRHGRSALQTAAILRQYNATRRGEHERVKDPVREERERRRLEYSSALGSLDGLVWRQLGAGKTTSYKVGNAVFVEHESGAVFIFPSQGHVENALANEFYVPGLWVAPGREDAVVKAVADSIWAGAKHGLELVADKEAGEYLFQFGALKEVGGYVDRPENGHAPLLAGLANRLYRFRAAGYNRKVLFHGPPGTGKSTLARMLAVRVGDGRVVRFDPKAVQYGDGVHLHRMLNMLKPTVVLLDDMDRAQEADGLLTHLEATNSSIVVGTVNCVSSVDPALLRPGRFDEVVEVGEPDDAWRAVIVEWYAQRLGVDGLPEDAVEKMAGFAPADIFEVLKVCGVVGVDLFDGEVERVRKQRSLYSGDRVGAWLESRRKTLPI